MNQEREAVACAERIVERTYNCGELEIEAKIVAQAFLALRSGGEGWRDISTAPKDGTRVLVHDGREPVVAFWHEDVRWERDRRASTADRDVTERVVGGWWEAYAETVVHPAHWKRLNAPSPSTHGEG